MNTEVAPENTEESLTEPSRGSAWVGVAVVIGFGIGAAGLWFMQEPAPVKYIDPKTVKYDRPEVAETGPYPTLTIDSAEHHFGGMELGDTGSHTYIVTNKGESELVLKQGPKSCACTRYDIEKTKLAPGESSKIIVEWKPKEAEMFFRQAMNLYTNDPEQTVLPLIVTGTVASLVQIIPKGEWDMGTMKGDTGGRREGVIVSALLEEFEITDIRTSHPELTVELVPAREEDIKSLKAKDGTELHAVLGTKIPAGPFHGTVTFKLKDRPDRDYTINVKGHRDGSIRFEGTKDLLWDKRRELVDLGEFPAPTGKSGRLFLYLEGDDEIEATDISTSPSFLQCTLEKDPEFRSPKKTRYILRFNVPPGSPTGGYRGSKSGRVRLKTTHSEYPELNLRVRFVTVKGFEGSK